MLPEEKIITIINVNNWKGNKMKSSIRKSPLFILNLCLLMIFSTPAYSMLLDGTFTGNVTSDRTIGATTVLNQYVGLEVSGTVRIDTDLAPADSYPEYDTDGVYSTVGGANWLEMSFDLSELPIVYDKLKIDFSGTEEQEVIIKNTSTYDQWNATTREEVRIYDAGSGANVSYDFAFSRVFFKDDSESVFNSDSLAQPFSWDGTGGSYDISRAEGTILQKNYEYINGEISKFEELYLYFDLTEFSLSEADSPSPVPVPAAVWLFSSGLIGLIGLARRKKA